MGSLWWDCWSGIAGDMAVASLLDCGIVEWGELEEVLRGIPVEEEFEVSVRSVVKGGMRACRFEVAVPGDEHGEPQGGHGHPRCSGHVHSHGHAHRHGRTLEEIERVILAASLPSGAEQRAVAVFRELAEAEGRVHGVGRGKVHFHEVGAVDAILDVVGACYLLDRMGVEEILVGPVAVGWGMVQTAHGLLPVPAPATAELLRGLPVVRGAAEAELTTPTGAALLRGLAARPVTAGLPLGWEAVGYGAGSYEWIEHDFLRAFYLPAASRPGTAAAGAGGALRRERVCRLSTDMDDCDGELLGFVREELFRLGALDVLHFPASGKKSRPAGRLEVLCRPQDASALAEVMLRELPTLGVRVEESDRLVLARRETTLELEGWGPVRCKLVEAPGGFVRVEPEADEVVRLARLRGLPYMEVRRRLEALACVHSPQAG